MAAALRPNPGHCPPEAEGKRVRVVLNNGYDTASDRPTGWPADGRDGCSWRRSSRDPWAIREWEPI